MQIFQKSTQLKLLVELVNLSGLYSRLLRSRIECASLIRTGVVDDNAFSFDNNNDSSCLIGTLNAGNSLVADHGDLVYHEPNFTGLLAKSLYLS